MRARLLRLAILPALLLSQGMPMPASAAPSSVIVPGELRADATFAHIGVGWSISGDTNLNSTMGAFEGGQPAPLYGPRVIVLNLPVRAYVPLARR